MHIQFCCEGLVVVVVLFICLGLLFLVRVSFVERGLCLFRVGFGYCSFFLVVQASVRFPNLPFVIGDVS